MRLGPAVAQQPEAARWAVGSASSATGSAVVVRVVTIARLSLAVGRLVVVVVVGVFGGRARSARRTRRRASSCACRRPRRRSPASSSRRTTCGTMPSHRRDRYDDAATVVARRATSPHANARQRLDDARASSGRVSRATSIRSPPTRRLSSAAVPRSITTPWSMTTISSARRSASSRYCVVSSVVMPLCTSSSMRSHIAMRLRGSRPVVGSSRNSTDGRPMRLIAMSSRRRMPPE